MNGDLLARVERLALPSRRLRSRDGRVFRLGSVVRFEAGAGATLAWLAGEKTPCEVPDNLNALERALAGLFVRCHRFHLVAVAQVRAVRERFPEAEPAPGARHGGRGAADECELILDDASPHIPVTSSYAAGVKTALGLASLHHLVPEHPDDRKLRLYGLTDFGWRELHRLDAADQTAVAAFRAAWDIKEFPRERMFECFRQFGAEQIDKRRLMKNIIYQMWRWIRKGIEPASDGNIRSLWYRIKGELSHHSDILDPGDVDMFYDVLREMVEDRRLFRYKDFGFMDMNEPYRAIGAKRPEVVLAVEKAGQYQFARGLAAEVGASFICLKGEPAVISIEYFSDELRAAAGDRPLSVFCMSDLDPAGYSIQRSLTDGLQAQGLVLGRVVKLVEPAIFADDVVAFSRYPVVRFEQRGAQIKPLKPATMSQVTKARTWLEQEAQDPRLYSEQVADGGRKIVTIWGIESDAADRETVRRRFLEGLKRTARRAVAGCSSDKNVR